MTIDERIEALAVSLELLNQSHIKTEDVLRRAIRLGIRESRSRRNKSRELDEKITQLASAQLLSEDKFTQLAAAQLVSETAHAELEAKVTELAAAQLVTQQLFQAWLKRGENGHE
jgi:hypothetical protein